jgi:hypothetical protein
MVEDDWFRRDRSRSARTTNSDGVVKAGMIQQSQVIELLLKACPASQRCWDEHREWWGAEDAGNYNDIAVFAHFAVDSFASGETDGLPALFGAIECVLTDGDERARQLASVGFLESVQNITSHRSFGYAAFVPWLGTNSIIAWRSLEKLWEGKASLMDVVRSQLRKGPKVGSSES